MDVIHVDPVGRRGILDLQGVEDHGQVADVRRHRRVDVALEQIGFAQRNAVVGLAGDQRGVEIHLHAGEAEVFAQGMEIPAADHEAFPVVDRSQCEAFAQGVLRVDEVGVQRVRLEIEVGRVQEDLPRGALETDLRGVRLGDRPLDEIHHREKAFIIADAAAEPLGFRGGE